MSMRTLLFSTAAVALIAAGPALAQTHSTRNATMPQQTQTQAQMPANGSQQMSSEDRNFVKEAAIGGMAEVELGKLAQQNGQSDQVKQFGSRMVQDHTQANNQLMSIAQAQNIQLPQQLDKKHEQLRDRLSRMQGPEFDRAYMQNMVKDHDEDMKLFRREADSGRDPQLKQFAQQTLQVIQQHDQLAKQIDHSVTATGSSRQR